MEADRRNRTFRAGTRCIVILVLAVHGIVACATTGPSRREEPKRAEAGRVPPPPPACGGLYDAPHRHWVDCDRGLTLALPPGEARTGQDGFLVEVIEPVADARIALAEPGFPSRSREALEAWVKERQPSARATKLGVEDPGVWWTGELERDGARRAVMVRFVPSAKGSLILWCELSWEHRREIARRIGEVRAAMDDRARPGSPPGPLPPFRRKDRTRAAPQDAGFRRGTIWPPRVTGEEDAPVMGLPGPFPSGERLPRGTEVYFKDVGDGWLEIRLAADDPLGWFVLDRYVRPAP